MLKELEKDSLEMRRKKKQIKRPEHVGVMCLSIEYPKLARTFSSSLSFLDPYMKGVLYLSEIVTSKSLNCFKTNLVNYLKYE